MSPKLVDIHEREGEENISAMEEEEERIIDLTSLCILLFIFTLLTNYNNRANARGLNGLMGQLRKRK